ncbi:TetR/AcrR family transcriptional regulator [Microvirga lotononidis]|uniref:Transcriptional regulator n=1 Tax=Microvirga lotononidis TaxID=864069 RepID=I4YRB3_9HYPH|nr:TetR/AcrR family transcriptional regulator [Microvirga lotononidis]EIM26505.1 transcriptional regulator [Microvirga lotononidis]WQO31190.1 TetR/AcrR family transcriptional regulator [Microvirga lotononidis]
MLSNIPSLNKGSSSNPRIVCKKRQILDGARQIFLQNGYADASMEEIAVQAGVSKGTLYNHFRNKDDLFKSLIDVEASRVAGKLPSPNLEEPNSVSALMPIGIAILQVMDDSTTVMTLRLIIGAVGRFPNFGEEFLTRSLGPTVERIAEYLDTHGAAGGIQIQDSLATAEQFTRWCLAHAAERVLMPDRPRNTGADCSAWVRQALRASGISAGAHHHA